MNDVDENSDLIGLFKAAPDADEALDGDYSRTTVLIINGLEWHAWFIRGADSKRWDMDRVYNYDNKLAVVRRASTGRWCVTDCPADPPGEEVGPYESFRDAMVAASTMVKLNQIPFKPGEDV